jgi:hypothetical protein
MDEIRVCPEFVCDGSGMVFNDESGEEEPCLCMLDPYAVEPIKDND